MNTNKPRVVVTVLDGLIDIISADSEVNVMVIDIDKGADHKFSWHQSEPDPEFYPDTAEFIQECFDECRERDSHYFNKDDLESIKESVDEFTKIKQEDA